jgi:hypothetical protein
VYDFFFVINIGLMTIEAKRILCNQSSFVSYQWYLAMLITFYIKLSLSDDDVF